MTRALPWHQKALIALFTLGGTSVVSAITFHLLFFYTDAARLPVKAVSVALLLSRVWDIVNDPLAGWLTDQTAGRFSRRNYVLVSVLPFIVSGALLWWVPSGLSSLGTFVWVLTIYVIFDTFFTLATVSLMSLMASMTDDYDDRTTLSVYNSVGAVVGFILGSAGLPFFQRWCGGPGLTGYAWGGIVLSGIAGVSLLLTGLFIHEPERTVRPTPGLKALVRPLSNRPFVWLLWGTGVARVFLTLMTAGLPYYLTHWVKDPARIPVYTAVVMVAVGLSLPLWKWVSTAFSKNLSYSLGLMVAGLTMIVIFNAPRGPGPYVWVAMVVAGLGLAAQWLAPAAMLPDAIDWDEEKSGERREGAHMGLYGVADKLARTISIFSLGWGLGVFGYGGAAPSESALLGIRLMFALIPGVGLLVAAGIMLYYPLSREAHRRLRQELDQKKTPGS